MIKIRNAEKIDSISISHKESDDYKITVLKLEREPIHFSYIELCFNLYHEKTSSIDITTRDNVLLIDYKDHKPVRITIENCGYTAEIDGSTLSEIVEYFLTAYSDVCPRLDIKTCKVLAQAFRTCSMPNSFYFTDGNRLFHVPSYDDDIVEIKDGIKYVDIDVDNIGKTLQICKIVKYDYGTVKREVLTKGISKEILASCYSPTEYFLHRRIKLNSIIVGILFIITIGILLLISKLYFGW